MNPLTNTTGSKYIAWDAVEETTSGNLEKLDKTDHDIFRWVCTLSVLIYRLRDFSAVETVK